MGGVIRAIGDAVGDAVGGGVKAGGSNLGKALKNPLGPVTSVANAVVDNVVKPVASSVASVASGAAKGAYNEIKSGGPIPVINEQVVRPLAGGIKETVEDLVVKPAISLAKGTNKHVIKPVFTESFEGIPSLVNDTAEVFKNVNDPTHPIGAVASLTATQEDYDNINANNKIIEEAKNPPAPPAPVANTAVSGQATNNTPTVSTPDIKGEDVARKIKGRAATLLTGPKGLLDVPYTAKRKLLGS